MTNYQNDNSLLLEEAIDRDLSEWGLNTRGGLLIDKDDELYHQGWRSIFMIGNLGGKFWQYFDSKKYREHDNPLDSWTRDVLTVIERKYRGRMLYPFEGPPYYPFLDWAIRSEGLSNSPLGILLHPQYGLWHAYRGALLTKEEGGFKNRDKNIHHCDICREKPCLRACPVGAFSEESDFDVQGCRSYLSETIGNECMDNGCRARKACIIGVEHQFSSEQSRHHNRYFLGKTTKD